METKITPEELDYLDLRWFATDKNGYIATFTSGGFCNVPKAVCESRENLETLERYFECEAKTTGECNFTRYAIGLKPGHGLFTDCLTFSGKGLVCYDMGNEYKHEENYYMLSVPSVYLRTDELPKKTAEILSAVKLSHADFKSDTIVLVKEQL